MRRPGPIHRRGVGRLQTGRSPRNPARLRREEPQMDDVVNRFAKELADAIAAAVAENTQVEACRAKAREAGFEMKVTLEAVVGFVNRNNGTAVTKITTPARLLPARRALELTANDKRFLRSLRIGADEAKEPTVEGQN